MLTLKSVERRRVGIGRVRGVVERRAGRERSVSVGRLGLIAGRGRVEAGRGGRLVPVLLEVVARRIETGRVPCGAAAALRIVAGRGAAVVARRRTAVVGCARAVVHGRLRAVHGRARAQASHGCLRAEREHGRGERAAGRARHRLAAVDHRQADEIDADRLALGVQLDARRRVRRVLDHADVALVGSLGDAHRLADERDVAACARLLLLLVHLMRLWRVRRLAGNGGMCAAVAAVGALRVSAARVLGGAAARAAAGGMSGTGEYARRHEARRAADGQRGERLVVAGEQQLLGGADEVAAVVAERLGVDEAVVAIQVFDLALLAGVRSVDHFDDVVHADRFALRVEGGRVLVEALLGDRVAAQVDRLVVHGEYAEGLLLEAHDHAHRVSIDLHKVAPLEVAQRVHARRGRLAQLQKALEDAHLIPCSMYTIEMLRKVREKTQFFVVDNISHAKIFKICSTVVPGI